MMMESTLHAALVPWDTFYVITGSSAAALTGLQFVVTTLMNDAQPPGARTRDTASASIGTFGTPTVVHFCAALLLSAMLSAPWRRLGPLRATVLAAGVAGLAYGVVVLLRARRQTAYRPVLEDWVWHVGLPLLAYGGLTAGALVFALDIADALFAVGAMTLLLLFIGIHNAWDTVAYITVERLERDEPAAVPQGGPAARKARRRRR
jgi:hypothetical protein